MVQHGLLTEDIHVSIFDAVNTLCDGLIVADVQYSQRESFPVCITGSFHQLIFTFQVTHRRYDCEQVEKKERQNLEARRRDCLKCMYCIVVRFEKCLAALISHVNGVEYRFIESQSPTVCSTSISNSLSLLIMYFFSNSF